MWKEIVRANTDKDGSVTLSGAAAVRDAADDPARAGFERLGARFVSGRFVKHSVPFERAFDNTLGEQFALCPPNRDVTVSAI